MSTYLDEAGAFMLAHVGQGGAEGAVALLRVVHGHAEGSPVQGRVGRRPGGERCRILKRKVATLNDVGLDKGTQTDRDRMPKREAVFFNIVLQRTRGYLSRTRSCNSTPRRRSCSARNVRNRDICNLR